MAVEEERKRGEQGVGEPGWGGEEEEGRRERAGRSSASQSLSPDQQSSKPSLLDLV